MPRPREQGAKEDNTSYDLDFQLAQAMKEELQEADEPEVSDDSSGAEEVPAELLKVPARPRWQCDVQKRG